MRCRVYRSLDRSVSVFGIRGRFAWLVLPGAGGAALAAVITGSLTTLLAGAGAGLVLLAGAYLLTLYLQTRIDDKDLWKVLARRAWPAAWSIAPGHVRNLWRGAGFPAGSGS